MRHCAHGYPTSVLQVLVGPTVSQTVLSDASPCPRRLPLVDRSTNDLSTHNPTPRAECEATKCIAHVAPVTGNTSSAPSKGAGAPLMWKSIRVFSSMLSLFPLGSRPELVLAVPRTVQGKLTSGRSGNKQRETGKEL